jgi:hypothetical protein
MRPALLLLLPALVACPKKGPTPLIDSPEAPPPVAPPTAVSAVRGDVGCGLTYALPGADEILYDALPTPDGGFLMLGTTRGQGDHGLFLRTAADGQDARLSAFGAADYDEPRQLVAVDGAWLAAGLSWRGERMADGWVVRLEATGSNSKERLFGDDGMDDVPGLLPDGAGRWWAVDAGPSLRLWRVDDRFVGEESVAIELPAAPSPMAVAAHPEGGGLIVGGIATTASETHAAWAARVGPDGALRWARDFDAPGFDEAWFATHHPEGWIVAGERSEGLGIPMQAWVSLIGDDGAPKWQAALGDDKHVSSVLLRPGGELWVAGFSEEPGGRAQEAWLAVLGPDGAVLRQHTFGPGTPDFAGTTFAFERLIPVGDKVVALGETWDPSGEADLWRVDLDAQGAIACPSGDLAMETR